MPTPEVQMENDRWFVQWRDGHGVARYEITRQMRPKVAAEINNAISAISEKIRQQGLRPGDRDELCDFCQGYRADPGI